MAREMALRNESREHRLVQPQCRNTREPPHRQERIYQRGWQNQVAYPQRRKENLAKRADINDSIRFVQPLQRSQRWPTEAILTVIVIFQNKRVGAIGPTD